MNRLKRYFKQPVPNDNVIEVGTRKRLIGTKIYWGDDEGEGVITDETLAQIYIESEFFTGWMDKTTYFEGLGIED